MIAMREEAHRAPATTEFTEAARYWRDYTDGARSRCVHPFWLNRVGYVGQGGPGLEFPRDIEIAGADL